MSDGPDDHRPPGPWNGQGQNTGQTDNYGNTYVPVQKGAWKGGPLDVSQYPGKSKGINSQLWGGPKSDGAPDWLKNIVFAALAMPEGQAKNDRIAHIMDSLATPGTGVNQHDVHFANAAFGFDDGHGGLDPKDLSAMQAAGATVGTGLYTPVGGSSSDQTDQFQNVTTGTVTNPGQTGQTGQTDQQPPITQNGPTTSQDGLSFGGGQSPQGQQDQQGQQGQQGQQNPQGPFKTPYPGQSVASGGVHTYGPDDAWAQANPGPWSGTGIANNNQVDQYGNVYVPVEKGAWQGGAINPNDFPGKSKGLNSQLWGGPTSDGAPDWFKKMVNDAAAMPDGPEKDARIAHIMDSIATPGTGINSHDVHYANAAFGFDDGRGGLDPKDLAYMPAPPPGQQ